MATCEHGVNSYNCKPCRAEYMRRWNKANRDKCNRTAAKKRARYIAAGLNNKGKPRQKPGRKTVLTPDQRRENARRNVARNNARVRAMTIELLGGECLCVDPMGCGGDDWSVLQFDHINGDGHRDRKDHNARGYNSIHKERRMYGEAFVRSKYQLLCANCHVRKTLASGDHLPKRSDVNAEGASLH